MPVVLILSTPDLPQHIVDVTVPDQRVIANTNVTFQVTFLDYTGEPTAPGGTVTVDITQADGTPVFTAGAATPTGTGATFALAASALAAAGLNMLTCVWKIDGVVRSITHVEICGGSYFTIADLRGSDPNIAADTAFYTNPKILDVRREVEDEAEWICDRAFVPRYNRITLDGGEVPEVVLPRGDIRTIRSVRSYSNATTYTAFTSTQVGALVIEEDGRVIRNDSTAWDEGVGNIVIEYEYGWDMPPPDLKRAAMLRARNRLNMFDSGVPDEAENVQIQGIGGFRNTKPTPYATGIAPVDAVYQRYSRRSGPTGNVPASRSMNLDPQWYSIFHGGRR